jgi:hypothetical protein
MKTLLLAGVAALSVLGASAIASISGYAADQPTDEEPPPARVTVTPPYYGPPPIGWVFGP